MTLKFFKYFVHQEHKEGCPNGVNK